MRRIKTFIVTLASLMLAFFTAVPCTALASENSYFSSDACYIVRVYSGNEGTFSGGRTCVTIPVKRGQTTNIWNEIGPITMNEAKDAAGNTVENKYHVYCIRQAGRDNVTAPKIAQGAPYTVNCDIDFVVGYAIEGGDVAYTVRYINESTGEKLADDDVFYGNVGDKPVVAFKFFDGMLPQAYNLTGTLKSDQTENVFTFKYRPGDTTALKTLYIDGGTTTQYVDGEAIERTLSGDGGGTTGTTGTDGGTSGSTESSGGTDVGQSTTPAASVDQSATSFDGGGAPASLIDIDDGTTPLADFGPGFDYEDQVATEVGLKSMPNAMKIGFGCLIAVVIGGIAFLVISLVKRKRQRA